MQSAPRFVLIDGIDGSGKTRFAERLGEGLRARGLTVTELHVDDFRRPVVWSDPRGEAEVYWNDYFDLHALEQRMRTQCRNGGFVLVEGIFTLRLAESAAMPLIYLEVGFEEAAHRILERDVALGRSASEVMHRIEARYFPTQRRYRAEYDPVGRATLLLDNSTPSLPRPLRADWSGLGPEIHAALAWLSERGER